MSQGPHTHTHSLHDDTYECRDTTHTSRGASLGLRPDEDSTLHHSIGTLPHTVVAGTQEMYSQAMIKELGDCCYRGCVILCVKCDNPNV